MRIFALIVMLLLVADFAGAEKPSLVQRLGFPEDAQVLIINADDFGMNHATNAGTERVLKAGAVTSATVMTPCGWFMEAADFARKNPKANIGVHTTLTSEWGRYKWGPVLGCSEVPGLCNEMGYFFEDVFSIYGIGEIDQAEREVRAQIDKAIAAGIDITHIDSHMGAMQYSPEYFDRYIRIAADYNLPCRLAGRDMLEPLGAEGLLDLAEELGVLGPEVLYMGDPPTLESTEEWFKDRISNIPKGKVSEMYIHCAVDAPEIFATTGSARRRIADTEFFSDPKTLEWIREQGIELISYRELKHLQQTGKPMPRVERYGWE
ncbi:MAG TPA: ChbG/HpnK family deacetylase [Candidatus Hydrogenedentes bacterium]|nr:ChbG/HpnK family deacetylase [Candidatus Hydrogenedentota bacterium]